MMQKPPSQSGNIFFMLFASVAMIGAFTVGSMNTIKGLVTSMSDVTRKTVAEEKMTGGARLAIQAATGIQLHAGDCDQDGMVEPLPYRDAGSSPHPAGGGFLPLEIGAAEKDPWGSSYGYCVWDAGSITVSDNNADCGGNTAKRLNGSTHAQHTTVAIISAGKDRQFSTTCNAYVDTTPADGNPDTAFITRTDKSDDIIMEYSYNDANGLSGDDLWRIRDTEPDTAKIDKNIEVTGSGQFTGPLNLMQSGLILPDETATGACDATTDQQLRVNYGISPPALEICDFTGGNDWTPVSMGGATTAGFCTFSPTLVDTGTTNTYGYETTSNLLLSGDNQTFRATTITDPLNISTWGSFSGGGTMDGIKSIAVSGNYAFTANATSNSISVVDISTAPSTTVAILQDATNLAGASDIEIYGNYAIVAAKTGNRITVVDISTPAAPVIAGGGAATIQDNVRLNAPNDLAIYSHYAIVASSTGDSVTAVDLDNPLVPVVRNITGTYGFVTSGTYLDGATNVAIKDDYAYVTTTTGNYLAVLDVIDGFPTIIATLQDSRLAAAKDLKIVGNYAFVASTSGLVIVDISNPFVPAFVDNYATGGTVNSLAVQNEYAFLSQASANVLDLGCDPSTGDGSPGIVSEIDDNAIGTASGFMQCENSRADAPSTYSTLSTGGSTAFQMFRQGSYLFINDNPSLKVYSIGSDGILTLVTSDNHDISSVWGDGTYIYTMDRSSNLRAFTFDGTSLTEETLLAVPDSNDWGNIVFGNSEDGHFYVTNSDGTVRAYSYDGSAFTLLGTYTDSMTNPSGDDHAWADGNYIYISRGTNELKIIQFNGSGFTSVLSASTPSGSAVQSYSDGDFLYVLGQDEIHAYSFDGTTLLLKGTAAAANALNIYGDGMNIFFGRSSGGAQFSVLRFNGSGFSRILSNYSVSGTPNAFFFDRNLVYVGSTGTITAYNGFSCTSDATTVLPATSHKHNDKIGAGYSSACYLQSDNSLWCWGSDSDGQIGNGASVTTDQESPVLVSASSYAKIYSGDRSNCAIKLDGTAECWGLNTSGKLGTTSGDKDAPSPVVGGYIWSELSPGGSEHGCGIQTDGTAWCWGADGNGQLGNGAGGSSTSPTQVSDSGPWAHIATGGSTTCGVKTDGSLWCWGLDDKGQLGNDSLLADAQIPVPVVEPGPWVTAAVSQSYACGIKTDGTMWCWGVNDQGAACLGEETFPATTTHLPKRVGDHGPWVDVKASVANALGYYTGALKSDGSYWVCGGLTYTVPTMFDSGPWAAFQPSVFGGCGIKLDGSVWCWGTDNHWAMGTGMQGNGSGVTTDQDNPGPVTLPRAAPWVWNDAGTSVSPPLLDGTTTPNIAIRSTSSISYDGVSSTGLRPTALGTTYLSAITTKSDLLLDTLFATGSAQMSWSNSADSVAKSLGIDYLTRSLEFGANVAGATNWMSSITPQFEITGNGNVGAGTTGSSLYRLTITGGGLRLGNDASDCTTFNKGTVRYVGGTLPFEYCTGSAWQTF